MKITKRQLRSIIKEAIQDQDPSGRSSGESYLSWDMKGEMSRYGRYYVWKRGYDDGFKGHEMDLSAGFNSSEYGIHPLYEEGYQKGIEDARLKKKIVHEAIDAGDLNPGFALEDRAYDALKDVFRDSVLTFYQDPYARLGRTAVRDLIALRDQFGPVDMLLGIWHWGRENSGRNFEPGDSAYAAADTHLRSLNIDPKVRRGAGNRAIASALDQLFST